MIQSRKKNLNNQEKQKNVQYLEKRSYKEQ